MVSADELERIRVDRAWDNATMGAFGQAKKDNKRRFIVPALTGNEKAECEIWKRPPQCKFWSVDPDGTHNEHYTNLKGEGKVKRIGQVSGL